jgi:outer membrane biosynthesis protein TonB
MLDLLVASHPTAPRSLGQAVLSLGLHSAMIAGAVVATRQIAGQVRPRAVETTLIFALKPPPPEPAAEPPKQETLVAVNPPPKGFQTVIPPAEIPKVIPPVDLTQRALDPRNFTGKGVEGGIAGGVVGGTGKVDAETPANVVYEAGDLDEPAQVISQPPPRYPSLLEQAGIPGLVAVQFVIGPHGTVEPGSLEVLSTTDSAFVAPARESILSSSFRPARFRGRTVRQLARQTIRFAIANQ